jgi:hypothetical protein
MCSSNNWNGSSAWTTSACGSGTTTIPNCSSSCTTNASVTNATATVNGNFGVNNLTLSQNGNLVVSAGQTLTIYGDLILSTNTGTITIDGGTLIVKGNVIVVGDENGVTIQDNGANKGSFQVTGNITACSDGTVTCSSPTAHTFNVNLNGTKSPNISVGGSVDLPGTAANVNGSGKISIGGNCIPAGNNGNQTFCYKAQGKILPITLSQFYAITNANSIDINWSTAAELNFDYFSLQKSANGKTFNEIAQIRGHGTTNEAHEYQFEDSFPLIGKNYYRLTSVDLDNYRETFKVILQNYSGEKNFQVSPNPSDGRTITLNFNFESTEGKVVIYDSMGSIVDAFQVDKAGEVSFSNSLKDGIYFAKYSSPSYTKAVRFLVQR